MCSSDLELDTDALEHTLTDTVAVAHVESERVGLRDGDELELDEEKGDAEDVEHTLPLPDTLLEVDGVSDGE